jgi:DNA-binding transcriptional regulator LsrR (DeoR family)
MSKRAKSSKRASPKDEAATTNDYMILKQAFLYSMYRRVGHLADSDTAPTQREFAEMIGTTPQRLAENLEKARKRGWLAEVVVPPDSMNESEWRSCQEQFYDFQLARDLMKTFRDFRFIHLPDRIHVVRVGNSRKPEEKRRTFSARASDLVLSILRNPQTSSLAVGWGRLMKSLCFEGLAPLCALRSPRTTNPLDIFPARGEPFRASVDVSPSTIAIALGRMLNGDSSHVHSLAGIPAVIPGGLSDEDVAAIHRMLREVPVFDHVFGSTHADRIVKSGLAERVTTVLASFGPAEPDSDWTLECASVSGFDKIKHLIAGDVAGIPVPKDSSATTRAAIEQYSRRLVGLSRRHIEECSSRARDQRSPIYKGVILVGMGRKRSGCLRRICELGWASVLIIDSHLAAALVSGK